MEITLRGRLFSGMGKGRYYVGHPEYQRRFLEKLGYLPYPGTLNVKLEESESLESLRTLIQSEATRIGGFMVGGESFSALRCYEGRLRDERATLLIIDVTYYNDRVMELISPTYLRGRYGLKDGDILTFETELHPRPGAR